MADADQCFYTNHSDDSGDGVGLYPAREGCSDDPGTGTGAFIIDQTRPHDDGGDRRSGGVHRADDPVPAAVRLAAGDRSDRRPADAGDDDGVSVYAGGDTYPGYCPDFGGPVPSALRVCFYADDGAAVRAEFFS